ncbi:protein kinase domain-containing protein [Rhodococcus sp. SJ-3]|uniref:protein kinase domain-containing protein n=1 Tax=Rhodococcus sp. SJ-3 TaxID=3454628 RepID=UPI003F791D7B
MVALTPGTVFAGYKIERLLGAGGMGSVYLADHPRLPRKIALKLLHRSLTQDQHASALFEREADHAARLDHPNIVSVLDRGREGDQLWIAMQYVAGMNASEAMAQGRLEPERAVRVIGEIAKALDYAHDNGVLHRDVKPANMLLEEAGPGRSGRVLLTDFGIAKALVETAFHTKTGMMLASLHYAAPEQFEGATLDGRADIYSLGCSLFHLLTGEPPYPGDSLPQLMHAHLGGRIPAPSWIVPSLPIELNRVVARAMAKNREDRYPTCVAFADAAAEAIMSSVRRANPTKVFDSTASYSEQFGSPYQSTQTPQPVTAQVVVKEPVHTPEPVLVQEPPVAPAAPPETPVTPPVAGGGAVEKQPTTRKTGWGKKMLAVAVIVLLALVVIILGMNKFASSDSDSPASVIPSTVMMGADGAEYTVSGSLLEKYYTADASQKADLGQPLGAEKTNPDGKYQWFVGGVIIQKTGNPAYIVWGEIRNKWNELGGSQGALGYPTSDEIDVDGVKVSTFENGSVMFDQGVVTVR